MNSIHNTKHESYTTSWTYGIDYQLSSDPTLQIYELIDIFTNKVNIINHFKKEFNLKCKIMFDEYHLINYHVQKEDAQTLIQNTSVIFLLGGNTLNQNGFLKDYELLDLIKKSRAVVMRASAGAINMSSKWLCSKNFGYKVEISSLYDGIGLDTFSVLSHFVLKIT